MSLPKGFKRLEYIQSSGTQYVDSGIKGSQNIRVDADYETTATAGAIIGADTAWGSNMFTIEVHFAAFAASNYHHTTVPSGRHKVSLNKGVFSLDGVTLSTMSGTFTTPVNMTLFALNRNGSLAEYGTLKLRSMQIYDNGTLVRDFIPCQNASGAVGLWDAVNSVFYGNAGTGAFTAGEVVEETFYTELEYIESDGSQYVHSNVPVKSTSGFEVDFQMVSASGIVGIIGGFTYGGYNNNFAAYNGTWNTQYGNNAGYQFGSVDIERHIVQQNVTAGTVVFDGETVKTGLPYYDNTERAFNLFCYDGGENYPTFWIGPSRIYSCRLYDNGTLIRDYIPMIHPSGVAGIWDSVNSRFYASASTTDLIAGPEAATVPKAPANFRVLSKTDTQVTLAWDPSEKALGYRLYRQGQLLADTEETSVAVTVEPFAGAVFTLTAYNENGEGAGTSLTYYSIPSNPLLYLITDRTQQDVTERNTKGYYAASDLNRVGYAVEYLAEIIRGYGYELEVSVKKDWTEENWATPAEMALYLKNLTNLKAVFSTLVELPETMEKINYVDANNIELLLLTIDETIVRVVAGFTRANAFGLRSGAKGLPVSQSDRGRNWGQLDAMETTWANWQLSTWYLLLYGNLKAEGVVE